MRLTISGLLLFVVLLGINWVYHTFYKPTELFFPVENALMKSPWETWREYGELFEAHSTAIITSDLLAALAQAEGSGNPVARTYWRWRFVSSNPLDWYQPASTAVGMFQITDGTFQDGKRYCIHNHVVVEEGPWHNFNSCWFNSFYTRVIPGHAIEMTAALLDRYVAKAVGDRPATFPQKQDLAAVIHLCGAGAGRDYVKRNFRLLPHQRCGDQDVRTYLLKIQAFKQQFSSLKQH
ncbi:MAG: transglycosylase [Nitrospira sp. SG-bin1]|nr:MAG: transglycosylase [Nitrospira sp. SG-bin1]